MSEAAAGADSSSARAAAGQAGTAGSKHKRQDLTLEQKVQVLDMW
jgi:hypothetical protein